MRRALVLLLISAAAVVAAPTIAGGGVDEGGLDVELVSPIEPLTFTATFESGTCEQGDFDADVEANDEPVTPISATQSDTDSDVFTFVLPPGTPAGVLSVDITCDNGDGNSRESGVREWASLAVTKTVVGPAPSSATFTVHVACESTLRVGRVSRQVVFAGRVLTDEQMDSVLSIEIWIIVRSIRIE